MFLIWKYLFLKSHHLGQIHFGRENFLNCILVNGLISLNYHVIFKALKYHNHSLSVGRCCTLCPGCEPKCSYEWLERTSPKAQECEASFNLTFFSPCLEFSLGKLLGRCYNQSWLWTILCILCQPAWKIGTCPQGLELLATYSADGGWGCLGPWDIAIL